MDPIASRYINATIDITVKFDVDAHAKLNGVNKALQSL